MLTKEKSKWKLSNEGITIQKDSWDQPYFGPQCSYLVDIRVVWSVLGAEGETWPAKLPWTVPSWGNSHVPEKVFLFPHALPLVSEGMSSLMTA